MVISERVIARIDGGSHGHAPVELSEAHVQCSERIDTLRQRGVLCLRPQHRQIYNSFAELTTGREYSLNSVANQGRLLQVGVGAIQPLCELSAASTTIDRTETGKKACECV